jgi:signal transduction histidine kinase/ActR/RegA family two-component response regulator
MRGFSLIGRILALTVVVVGSVSLLGLMFVVQERIESAHQRYRQEARSFVVALTPMLQNALVVGDLSVVQQTFDQLVREESLRRVALLDSAIRRVIVESVDDPDASDATVPGEAPPHWFAGLLEVDDLVAEKPIQLAGTDYGTLRVEMSNAPLRSKLWTVAKRFTMIGSIGLLLIVAVLGAALRRGLAPLQLLTRGARQMEDGNLDARIPAIAIPEIAAVGEAFNDMADRVVAREGELKEAYALADGAARAKAAFLATMSHEIRTPMNGIIGLTDLTLLTPLSDEQRGYLELVKSSAGNLLVILNDILDYSKIDAGKLTLEAVPVSLREMVPQILALFASRANDRGIALRSELAPGLPERVIADPVRLRQILSNLVSNAVKFTECGHVLLRIEPAGEDAQRLAVRFAVEDTGIGIAPDKIRNVFEPFVQADDSTTRTYGGTGLGLAICTNLIRLMGGELAVASTQGVGSRFSFTLTLPVAPPQPAGPRARTPAPVTAGDGKRRILVAEDSPVNQALMRAILGKSGYSFVIVEDGQAAVDACANERYDLILMDMQMPNLDGLAATACIREAEVRSGGPRTPIVALTANAFDDDRRRCLQAGMDDFLAKPFHKDALLAIIQRNRPPA